MAALEVIEIRDLRDFVQEFVTSRGFPEMDALRNDLSSGANLGPGDGNSVGLSNFMYGSYFFVNDLYQFWNRFDKDLPSTALAIVQAVYAHDALCRNGDTGWWRPTAYRDGLGSTTNFYGASVPGRFVVGQPNLQTSEQSFYWFQDGGWHQHRTSDTSEVAVDVWPEIGDRTLRNNATNNANEAGFWRAGSGTFQTSPTRPYHAIAFEGITDTSFGMPGETDPNAGMLRGSSDHQKGLMLCMANEINLDGSGAGGTIREGTWLWVDLDTGLAVGKLGVFSRLSGEGQTTTLTPSLWTAPSIDNREFVDLAGVQFVPDIDSSYLRPKGEIHIFSALLNEFEQTGITMETPVGSFVTTATRNYVQVFDFNPFNQSGLTPRTHNKLIFEGIMDIPFDPIISGGATATDASPNNTAGASEIFYHPPSRSYCNIQSTWAEVSQNGPDDPAVGSSRLIRWRREHQPDAVTIPSPDAAVTENGSVRVEVFVTSTESDPIEGHTVHFQSFRQSTRSETFDGTAQAGADYVVDNAPIDDDGHLEVYEGGTVDTGGTLLVLGVDYTVSSFSTGTLSPVGSWPSDTISVRYRHRAVEITPGFGTLVSASAVTDEDGLAVAVIDLQDELGGELVGLNVDTESAF